MTATIGTLLAAHVAGKPLTATIEETYDRIAAHDDPALFIAVRPKAEALAIAARLEASGSAGKPLYGAPFVVKDNIDVAGLPTTAACPAFAYRPERSAFVVERLERAGAIVIGKTNLDQFATGLVGVRSPYGVPRNALRSDLIPGGSSSGSATAVGAGLVPFSLGTDTAGSGRVPAALNGIVGLKPSLGALSAVRRRPCLPHARHRLDLRPRRRRRLRCLSRGDRVRRARRLQPRVSRAGAFGVSERDSARRSPPGSASVFRRQGCGSRLLARCCARTIARRPYRRVRFRAFRRGRPRAL